MVPFVWFGRADTICVQNMLCWRPTSVALVDARHIVSTRAPSPTECFNAERNGGLIDTACRPSEL